MKERLVGAAVLVALGVWLIPWLLDGPEDPAVDGPVSLQLPIPQGQAAADVRTEVVDLNARREAGEADGGVAARTLDARRASAAPARDPASGSSPGGASAAGNETNARVSAVSNEAAAASARNADDGVSAARNGELDAQARTRAAPAAAPAGEGAASPAATAAPQSASAGDWAIQLGSFGDEENAHRLAERVSTYGYEPQISSYRASGRTMYRVRVGPHETRADAEAAASSLSAHGFIAQVVTVD